MKQYLPWLASLALILVAFGTIYTVAQQSQRSEANYPQIQIAQDAAYALDHGDTPLELTHDVVNISSSLAPFTIIYDKDGRLISSSGYINGKTPVIPKDSLTAAKGKDYSAVTWQPQKNVRIAAVTATSKNYYVLSGRSLKEVEKNETTTLQLVLLGGAIAVMLLGFVYVLSGMSTDDF